ncbi:MAG TPA: bifunctional UDP-N-acetylglucosamine diphosphorylase/glucosamine-1-phosphate N-acetyltransferase GlmU [Gaiellaceae bacterium]|jgi:bifunctional UDP-N-acetylglucosamine pyrophosphorylase/glucosamine-1-phosphate N-acetyltransferase|nr:bifunctional UDP-N-acetylglucosamine diphosphorylase/glucosamine-1-phosphate N-acetyltransferase GlmU [Gaiellaceae bacterium]
MSSDLAAVVMAGGLGTRMKSSVPKHLHPLLGRRVVDWVLEAARGIGADPLVVVASPDTSNAYDGVTVAVQREPRGTGDAVASARETLDGFSGSVLVLDAAAPLLTADVLAELVAAHRESGAAVTILTLEPDRPLPYGRIIRGEEGDVRAIVEEKDATPEQRAVRELNSSIYVFEADALRDALSGLRDDNAQGELYLTDTIAHIVEAGGRAAAWRCDDELATLGINDRAELALAAAALRDRINEAHMLAGVTIVDPASTWIDAEVELEPDAVIHPFTVLRGRTKVAAGAEFGPHAVAIDAEIGERVLVGPFCYLRPGTVLAPDAKAGTFVEIKNSRIGARTKVPHLSYLGDAEIGEDTNIAAGNITVNFPHQQGLPKGRTTIGSNVRTGVQNAFVAPVDVGDDAWIAAGSVITKDVPSGSLAIARAKQENKEGYARRKRND